MNDILRQEISKTAHTLVVKIGTRVLTGNSGRLDLPRIHGLADDIHHLWESGHRVILVSSGAVAAGMSHLGLADRPRDLAPLQAVAAVGQPKLIEAYDSRLRTLGRSAAQILLTAEDVDDRTRYLNVRNTLVKLLGLGVVPIVNENDTVSVDELLTTFGDNDRLAALVTNLVRAPLLIMLSDVEGLYDGDPSHPQARLISTVTKLDDSVLSHARDCGQGLSKGGMLSKLRAAQAATMAGENVVIASGRRAGILRQIMDGERVGTLFLAQGKTISPWKRWIGFSAQPRGSLVLDLGARQAIEREGRSLLPIGVVRVEGTFAKGDVVTLLDAQQVEFARGLCNYSSGDVGRIAGQQSDRIAEILGHSPYAEVMHRDNIALTR